MKELIKFGADWCGPCRAIAPTIKKLEESYNTEGSDVKVTDINVDQNGEMASKYGVRSIPTLIFLKDGEVVERKVGVLKESEIIEILNNI